MPQSAAQSQPTKTRLRNGDNPVTAGWRHFGLNAELSGEEAGEAETNGDNYDISTEDIVARLKKWQKLCSFRISGVDYNTVTLEFGTLPKDIKAFIRDAYDLCPDLVQTEEEVDLPMYEKQLPKTKKLDLWWD